MAPSEDLPVTHHQSIYPGIDPSKFRDSCKGKVVLITGASRGIGEATAYAFAECGASLFLVSRNQATIDQTVKDIESRFPCTKVGSAVADVVQHEQVGDAVKNCIEVFGKVDVVISNSGAMEVLGVKMADQDPDVWWNIWEVNVRGSFNLAHYALPYLEKTKGYFIFIGSIGGQIRVPGSSAYQTTKHVINRVAEFAHLEHGDAGVKIFSLHPGGVKTELSKAGGERLLSILNDDVTLGPWTMVRLVSGSEDYLAGRYVSAAWDLDEVAEKYRERILKDDALKNRLTLPLDQCGRDMPAIV
ncbi:NAD-P-binding protein [Calocera viscosa TUFC12733]|uniref:NAD-P-binding protein n=1 Tax=Calocera viscosa (strain TUFC12733) TaxID=1330018 RepID=A0A167QXX3_CALVF|nr:NAD-P-binding protein [Calocera viscosa TUFC12733]